MAEYDPHVALEAAREVVEQPALEAVSKSIVGAAGKAALSLIAAAEIEQQALAEQARATEAARRQARKVEQMSRVNVALLLEVGHAIRDRTGLQFEGVTTEKYEDWLAQRTQTVFARPPRGSNFAYTEYSKTADSEYAMNHWSRGQRPVPLWIVGHQQDKKVNRYVALAPYCAGMRLCVDGQGGIRGGPNDDLALYRLETKRRQPLGNTQALPDDDTIRAAYDPAQRTFTFEQARIHADRSMPRLQRIDKIDVLSDADMQHFGIPLRLAQLASGFNATDILGAASAEYNVSRQRIDVWDGHEATLPVDTTVLVR